MNNDELKRAGEVMIASAGGKLIECRLKGESEWMNLDSPMTAAWNWTAYDYRVKSKPKLRPWKLDEVPLTWLRDAKYGLQQYSINTVSNDGIHINSPCKTEFVTFTEALKRFEYKKPDGSWSPCGVEVEE